MQNLFFMILKLEIICQLFIFLYYLILYSILFHFTPTPKNIMDN